MFAIKPNEGQGRLGECLDSLWATGVKVAPLVDPDEVGHRGDRLTLQVLQDEDFREGDRTLFLISCLISDVLLVLERVE